jgi:transcriptional regulator with XRE-family HTH domain
MLMQRVAANTRFQRDQRGWTQAQLAERVGTTTSYINDIEKQRTNGSLEIIERLADAFEIDAGVFVNGASLDTLTDNEIELVTAYRNSDALRIMRVTLRRADEIPF